MSETKSPTISFIKASRTGEIPPGCFDIALQRTGSIEQAELDECPKLAAAVAVRALTSAAYLDAIKVKPAASNRKRDAGAYERRLERARLAAGALFKDYAAASIRVHYIRTALNFERQPDPRFQSWWRSNPLRSLYLEEG